MMKKAGIVTWYRNGNFGGTLQAYGLAKTVEMLGWQPEFIHYEKRSMVRMLLRDAGFHAMYLRSALSRDCIWRFVDRELPQTPVLKSYEAVREYSRSYDAVICGSDQIWNAVGAIDSYYYLQFADINKRIAYAPSFGVTAADEERRDAVRKYVGSIPYLSVREVQGAEYIHDLCGRDAHVAADPSLLLNKAQWKAFAAGTSARLPEEKKYIAAYILGDDGRYEKNIECLSRKLNLPVFYVSSHRKNYRKNQIVCDPEGFVAFMLNAACVVTDSFHGTIFSLNMDTPVCVFERFDAGDPNNQNSRIHSILRLLDCADRLTPVGKEIDVERLLGQRESMADVRLRLDKMRKESMEYLKNALDSVAAHAQ